MKEICPKMRYFCSDFHVNHVNIIKYCPWNRPFDKVEDMNLHLLDTWNSVVKDNDTVYFLGDFAMKFTAVEEYLPLLNGKIVLIEGNHDKWHRMHKGHIATRLKVFKLNPKVVDIQERLIIELDGNKVLLCHFPWKGADDERHESNDKYESYKPERKDYPKHTLLFGHRHSRPEDREINQGLEISYDAWGRMVSEEDVLEVIRRQKIAQN